MFHLLFLSVASWKTISTLVSSSASAVYTFLLILHLLLVGQVRMVPSSVTDLATMVTADPNSRGQEVRAGCRRDGEEVGGEGRS